MKAISTRYIGATTHRPARILATDQDGNRITLPADGDFPYDDVHRAAAVALCASMRWPGAETLVGGSVKHGMVWVFATPIALLTQLAEVAADARDHLSCNCSYTAEGPRCDGTCTHGMALRALAALRAWVREGNDGEITPHLEDTPHGPTT